jgi:hypothetical protein
MAHNETVGDEPVIFINVFDVDGSKQQDLIDLLDEGAERVMRRRAGFVSSSILASNDGTRVVNYAEWQTLDDVKATLADPDVTRYAQQAAALAKPTPHVYTVAAVHRAVR